MDGPLILIASYPKSGNTWTRVVLHGLLNASSAGDLNAMTTDLFGGSKRFLFDEFSPAEMAAISTDEIDDLMPSVYRNATRSLTEPILLKTHEKARKNRAGDWIYPPECVRAVICIVRHPLDVAASFAHHMGYGAQQVVENMREPFWFSPQQQNAPLAPAEFLGSWSENVRSWTSPDLPYRRIVMRYEDLLCDDLTCFRRMVAELELPFTEDLLKHAVENARFDKLKAREVREGFREKPRSSPNFFRSGSSMSWTDFLSDDLRIQIVRDHKSTMKHFGYLADGSTSMENPF
jgi:aryl sulfotransferase